VLANPHAGRGRGRRLLVAVLSRLAAAGRDLEVLDSGSRAGALAAVSAAVRGGAGAVVAVGGDGTAHLALQAVAGTAVPLGLVPVGTGNDLAAELGVAGDPLAAAAAIATVLRGGSHHRRIDLARIDPARIDPAVVDGPGGGSRWYGGVLAAGFDAIVNERANRMRFPRGPRRYDMAVLAELARLRPRRYRMRLDGVPQEVEAVLVAVGNTGRYGGGMRVCPAADPTDGQLDVLLVGPVRRRELVRMLPRVYRGTHLAHPQVRILRAGTVQLDGEPIVTYADGERAYPLPVTITAVPGALLLLG
jgi:diacylglycerol kinase (ATP)